MPRPSIAEIDLAAVACNFRQIRKLVGPDVKICPAVKANAYGHGAVPVSRTVLTEGADMLGVATVEEGIELREAGINAPILLMGCIFEEQIPDIVRHVLTSTVCSQSFAEEISRQAIDSRMRAKVHVKTDTGMGRIGVQPQEAVDFVLGVSKLPGLEIEGMFTHFACADEDPRFTREQASCFGQIIRDIESAGIRIPIRHAANSAAILGVPETYFNMVRPGIMLYGLYDSAVVPANAVLRQAMTLKTKIVFLKEIPPGGTVSYGRTFTATRPTLVATLPIGYGDGYNRLLSNRAPALVRGRRVSVIGRVCMDQTMLDVTDVHGVSVGDEVVLYGSQGDEHISIREIAHLLGTITYEVTCSVGKRVPRVYSGIADCGMRIAE